MKNEIKASASTVILAMVVLAGVMFFGGYQYAKSKLAGTVATGPQPTAAPQAAGQAAAPTVTMDQIRGLFGNGNIALGDKNSKLIFVEVSDPSCPYCHIAGGQDLELNAQSAQFKTTAQGGTYDPPVPEMKKLVDAGKAAFVYIYSPGHGNGEMGVRALYCGNELGKFWEVHDLIMSQKGYQILNGYDANNTPITGTIVKNDKTKSGDLAAFLAPAADATKMKACLDSGKYDGRLTSDAQLATSLGVQGTPGFFVNTTNFAGAYSFTEMQTAVDAALK